MQEKVLQASSERGKWMALIAALLGWMFDGFEMGLFPLIGKPALQDLLQLPSGKVVDQWFGVILAVFLVGAATGGVFFGWLGDRIGRVRAMSLSIFTYAIFTGLCGFASEAWHIAALRFIASLGMGGEWSLGVALVTELWPDRSRAFLAGLIGAAANVGFLAVGLLSLVLVSFLQGVGEVLLQIGFTKGMVGALLHNDGWRLLMILGALPALLVFFIRLFVPESHKWEAEREKGATSYWATRDLLGVLLGGLGALAVIVIWSPYYEKLAILLLGGGEQRVLPAWSPAIRGVGTILGVSVALVGYIYPVKRYLARAEIAGTLIAGDRAKNLQRLFLGACLAGVALLGTWGSVQWAPQWAIALSKLLPDEDGPYYAKEYTQISSAAGAIVGTILAALAAGRFGRRITYCALCLTSFASLVYLYQANDAFGYRFLLSVFVVGGITAAFYGWFPLYFPEIFPTSIRATGQGFAFNFGRVLSAIGTLQTATVTAWFAQGIPADRQAIEAFPKAGTVLAAIYLVGLGIIWLGPETKGKALPA